MKFGKDIVEFFGNFICSSFLDIFLENKLPQVVLELSADVLGREAYDSMKGVGRIKQRMRIVVLDNSQVVMSKEDISRRIADLQSRKTDVGFSYTSDGLRIIVVPESITYLTGAGAPFGAGQG